MSPSKANVADDSQPRSPFGNGTMKRGYPIPPPNIPIGGTRIAKQNKSLLPSAASISSSQKAAANTDASRTRKGSSTYTDSDSQGHGEGSRGRSTGNKPDTATAKTHDRDRSCSRNGATKDSSKAKKADVPFHSDEDAEFAIQAPLVISYLGKDGCSKRIWVPKGLAKKHSKLLANYIDDSDGPQELEWSDLWNDYIQGGKANSGSALESLRVNGNCEVSPKSSLEETKFCESREREQGRVIEAGTSDPCQDDPATLQESYALIDVSMPPNQQVKSGECPPSEHQGTHLRDLEGYDSVLGEMIAIQFAGMSMEVGKNKIVASTEFPGPEQDRSATVHQNRQANAVSGSQVNSRRLPKDVEQIILQEIQDGGIDVSGMDLSEDFKDMIASEGKKQHVDHLKREEYTKDDIWEVFKVFSKWLVTGRIVRAPYIRPSSTTGPSYTLDLGEILWHGRMFMSKEFTATMHRTIKREGAICTHTFNPSKLNTMRLAKWMYDTQVEAYFDSVEARQAMRAKDAARRRESEKQAREARDEEAERAVNPNLDAVLAIDNLGKKEATTPLTTHELPEISLTSLTSRGREIPSLYRPGGEINNEITPPQRRVPIVGASYDSDVAQGPRTRNTAAIPRTQRRELPVQGTHHRGGLPASRNRCQSPDCRHRRDRPSRVFSHHASGEPRSHYRKPAPPQNTPQLGRVRREERYSDK